MIRWQVRSGEVVLQQLPGVGGWKDVSVVDEQGKALPGLPQAVKIEPGDVVVVRLDYGLARYECDQLALRLKPAFPKNEIVVLNPGMSIETAKAPSNE